MVFLECIAGIRQQLHQWLSDYALYAIVSLSSGQGSCGVVTMRLRCIVQALYHTPQLRSFAEGDLALHLVHATVEVLGLGWGEGAQHDAVGKDTLVGCVV